MTDARFQDHELQAMASISHPNERERRMAVELLARRDALARIRDLTGNWPDNGTWKTCAARCSDISQIVEITP
jgi:hypothetical protein